MAAFAHPVGRRLYLQPSEQCPNILHPLKTPQRRQGGVSAFPRLARADVASLPFMFTIPDGRPVLVGQAANI